MNSTQKKRLGLIAGGLIICGAAAALVFNAFEENLVFFSVPYDDGFTAYVNGQETDILQVDEGLMAVLCPAGTNRVDFVYQADGYSLSRTVTLAAIPVFAVYCGFWWDRKKRKTA